MADLATCQLASVGEPLTVQQLELVAALSGLEDLLAGPPAARELDELRRLGDVAHHLGGIAMMTARLAEAMESDAEALVLGPPTSTVREVTWSVHRQVMVLLLLIGGQARQAGDRETATMVREALIQLMSRFEQNGPENDPALFLKHLLGLSSALGIAATLHDRNHSFQSPAIKQ